MKLKNNKGFTLVEVLIATGIVGGLSVLVMNLMSQSSKTSSKMQSDIEATTIANEIMGYLADPLVCSAANNLGGKNTAGLPGADLNVGLTSIQRKNGSSIYSSAGGPYGGGSLFIDSYRLQDTAGDDVNTAASPRDLYLVINFRKKQINQTAGATTFQRKIKIAYQTTANDTTSTIAFCKAVSTGYDGVWTRGTGANINDITYSNGLVGIGTLAPDKKLHIYGTVGNQEISVESTIDTQAGLILQNSQRTWKIMSDSSSGAGSFSISDLTAGLSRLVINSGGNVGLSTVTPFSKLSVNGNAAIGTYSSTTAAPANGLIVSGFIGAGASAPVGTEKLYANGDARVQADLFLGRDLILGGNFQIQASTVSFNKPVSGPSFTTPSDKRLKENFVELKDSLEKILKIKTYSFYWKDKNYGSEKQIGFIAQELKKIFPDLVIEGSNGYQSVNYSLVVVPLIKAIQEQNEEIMSLKKEMKKLSKRQERLEFIICELKPKDELCE